MAPWRLLAVVLSFATTDSQGGENATVRRKGLSLLGPRKKKKHTHVLETRRITAIVTTCGPDPDESRSLRFEWLLVTLRTYLSDAYADVLHRVIVVWNSPDAVAPELTELLSERLVIVEAGTRSLNNRWIKTIPHVVTETVLNVDDDVVALKPAIQCLLLNARPGFVAGPFARTVGKYFNYSTDERTSGARPDYALILPRVMLLHRDHLLRYARAPREFLRYIDAEPAHSDDILLNLVTADKKLRVIPPAGSVVDYDRLCHNYQPDTHFKGLGTMKHRSFARTAAMRTMGLHYTDAVQYASDSKTCDLVLVRKKSEHNETEVDPRHLYDEHLEQKRRPPAGWQHVLRARDVADYEHWALTDDMFAKFRKRDAERSAARICHYAPPSTAVVSAAGEKITSSATSGL